MVQFYGAVVEGGHLLIVSELMEVRWWRLWRVVVGHGSAHGIALVLLQVCALIQPHCFPSPLLAQGGNLRAALNEAGPGGALSWSRGGRQVAIDVARGLCMLHAQNVIHRCGQGCRAHSMCARCQDCIVPDLPAF